MSKKHINDNDNDDSSNEENESIENIDDVLDKDESERNICIDIYM